jgi:heat shock protein HslJ
MDHFPSGAPTAASLSGTWNLASIQRTDGALEATPPGATYHITFADGRASTRADCNTCGGAFSLTDRTITIGPLMACTRAACSTMSFENAYVSMLAGREHGEPPGRVAQADVESRDHRVHEIVTRRQDPGLRSKALRV